MEYPANEVPVIPAATGQVISFEATDEGVVMTTPDGMEMTLSPEQCEDILGFAIEVKDRPLNRYAQIMQKPTGKEDAADGPIS